MNADETYGRWRGWIKQIDLDVTWLADNRAVWSELFAIVDANPSIPQQWEFMSWVGNLYGVTQALGVRRQTRAKAPEVTMRRLVKEIHNHPGVLTRERYAGLYRDSGKVVDLADAHFDHYVGREGAEELGPSDVQADLAELQRIADAVHPYVNKHLAHSDENPAEARPSFVVLDGAISLLENMLVRYLGVIRTVGRVHVAPTRQKHWQVAFTVPWIKP